MRKDILRRLNKIVKTLATSAIKDNKPVVHANGIIANTWEVKKIGKNNYSILCPGTKKVLAKDIVMYEVAFNVAYLLNKGFLISSANITEILKHHDTFSQKFQEAVFCKQRRVEYIKAGDWAMYDIVSAKYHQAKLIAYTARQTLKKLTNRNDKHKLGGVVYLGTIDAYRGSTKKKYQESC